MKAESAIVIAVSICLFLSFYFSLLSFMTIEELMRKQFVVLAVYSLLSGILVFGCLIIYLVVKRVFVKTALNDAQAAAPQTEG